MERKSKCNSKLLGCSLDYSSSCLAVPCLTSGHSAAADCPFAAASFGKTLIFNCSKDFCWLLKRENGLAYNAHHIVIHSTAEFIKRRLLAGLGWMTHRPMAVHLNIALVVGYKIRI